MDAAKWQNIKRLMSATLDLPESERAVFLRREPDTEIRREVEKLLVAHAKSEKLFDRPFVAEYGLSENGFEENLVGAKIDNYRILEKIGEGGMGTVFLAEHAGEDFSQKVALKLIKRGMDTGAVLRRFLMERHILAQLEHPFIARLFDGGSTPDGLPYFVMEYVEGESIKKFCENHCFDTKERLELFRKVCEAASYAHQKLVVHRDIKPSNIIVTENGTPKLLDFGIAKLLSPDWHASEREATATNLHLMTPEYASPEQLRGKITTVSTDVYSLGVVLYELLTGARPFDLRSKNALEAAAEILTKEPLLPSSVVSASVVSSRFQAPGSKSETNANNNGRRTKDEGQNTNPKSKIQNPKSLRGDLDNIILKAIRREPESRYASVQEFSEDIRRHLAGLPVSATADSTRYRVSKFIGRHRRGAALAAFVSLVIFALSGLSIYQGAVAMRERDKANERFEKLRDVARLLMTDTHDSLSKIPGTVQIQKSLAEKSVDLLDSIYDENNADPQFLSEIAQSYEKLCRSQLWQFRNFEQSQKSCTRAVEIRRRVINLEPDRLQRKNELVSSLANFSEIIAAKGEKDFLLKINSEIEALRREVAAKEPTEKNLSNLAYQLLGSSSNFKHWGMTAEYEARQKEGGEIMQRMIDGYEGRQLTPPEKTELAWHLMWRAKSALGLGDDEKARRDFELAAALAESAYRADNSLQSAFNHTSRVHRSLGEIYEKRGDYRKAFEMYKFSYDWLRTRENDASQIKANIIFGIHFYANRCALMLNRLGRRKEADELIVKPFRDYSDFLDVEENAASLLFAREPFLDLTRYFAETDRLEKAVEVWQRHNDRVQKFLEKNADDIVFLQYQVEAQTQIGEIYSAYDEKSDSFKTTDAERLKKARTYYGKASELYRKAQTMYAPTQLEKELLQKIERKIEKLIDY